MAFIECIGDMIKLMIEKGVEAVVPIIAQAKRAYSALASPSLTVRVEFLEVSPTTINGPEVGFLHPSEEGYLCPFPNLGTFGDILKKNLL